MSKKILQLIFWGALLGLLILSQCSNEDKNSFILLLTGMEDLEIENVLVTEENFTTTFHSLAENWDEMSRLKIKVTSLNKEGTVNLTITTLDNTVLTISNVPFKLGKTTYINEYKGKLGYVKAHWQ